MDRIFFKISLLGLFLGISQAAVTDAQVFDWWDAGIITPEEADEILLLLDEGNTEEACLLAEVYAQEPCEDAPSKKAKSAKQKEPKRPSLKPTGYVLIKARLDSSANLESHREELHLSFYRYTLRLGSQRTLSYKNGDSEAHFGEFSTNELHSHIPLDTLWGTALLYPVGNFRISAALDTSSVARAGLGYVFGKQASITAAYWDARRERHDEFRSASLQADFGFGKASVWYQGGQDAPLAKIELRHGNRQSKKEPVAFGWRTTAYIHGDSIPAMARLSSTIRRSRLWGAQTVGLTAHKIYNTKFEFNTRFINPLHGDSVSTRLKATLQSGPEIFRGGVSATCIELRNDCEKSDWKGSVQSGFSDNWTAGASARERYSRKNGPGPPRIETFLRYRDSPGNYAKLILVAPDARPSERLQLQNEAHFAAGFLNLSITTTFQKNVNKPLHPSHGSIAVKWLF